MPGESAGMPGFEFGLETEGGRELFARGWETAGEGRAVLCLVHGLGEHCARYSELAGRLNGAGYTVLSFDLPGHGMSAGRRGHVSDYSELRGAVSSLMREAGIRYSTLPQFLYGQSLGGNIVLDFILNTHPPVAGAIVTSPLLRPSSPPPSWKLALVKLLRGLVPGFQVSSGIDPVDLSRTAAVVSAYVDDPLVHDRVSARMAVDMLEVGLRSIETANRLETPLLLMHGSADRITSPEASVEFADRAGSECSLVIWDGLLHELHNEPESGDVLSYMLDWLHGMLNSSPSPVTSN